MIGVVCEGHKHHIGETPSENSGDNEAVGLGEDLQSELFGINQMFVLNGDVITIIIVVASGLCHPLRR